MSNLEKSKKNIVEVVSQRVDQLVELGQLQLPKDFSASNAIRAAWLTLQDKPEMLAKATDHSVINAMFKMVVMGLSVAKGQGSFILYGNKLSFNPEYVGNKLLAKRWAGVKSISHNTVYENDVFEYTVDKHGRKQLYKHEQKLENIDMDKIIAAYCVVTHSDNSTEFEVMNKDQIKKAWLQGPMKGQSPAHKNFPDRMSEKTVANRILTGIYRATDDGAILDAIEKKDEEDTDGTKPQKRNTESKTISFDEPEHVEYEDNVDEPEEAPEPPKEKPKKESKPEAPKEEKKAAGQPKMEFDDNDDNSDEPF